MMVEDGDQEVLKLLSSTSAEISQGEVLQLQHNGEIDMLEETYLKNNIFEDSVSICCSNKSWCNFIKSRK